MKLSFVPPPKKLFVIVLILALLWPGMKLVRSVIYARQVYASGTEILTLLRSQPLLTNAPQLQRALHTIDRGLAGISTEMQPLMALGSPLRNSSAAGSAVGSVLAAAPELLAVGRGFVEIGERVLSIDGLVATGNQAPSLESQMAALTVAEAQMAALADQADRLQQRLDALPLEQFPPTLAELLARGQQMAKPTVAGLHIAPLLPTLLGFDQTRTYLLLVQNNHELRATGGFITAVGLLTLTDGHIVSLDFKDSYDVANAAVDHPWAPDPMQRYLGIDLLFLRDVNWSPDFPTTAQLARTLYAQNEAIWVDGVIALDLRAVELLVGSLGSLRVPGVEQPITGANMLAQMKAFWRNAPTAQQAEADSTDWWRQRKDFMPLIAAAAFERIDAGNVDYPKLGLGLLQALDERAIQIWVTEQDVHDALARADWNGALQPPPNADFLALVDSNFGYNKVDSAIQRTLNYQVTWPTDVGQPGQAVATITYVHPLTVPNHRCDPAPHYGDTYDDMIARCYFDYVRLYTPAGSRLIDVEGVDRATVHSTAGENGTQVFEAYFQLAPGAQQQLAFHYELPPALRQDAYQLTIRRQAGTAPLALQLNIGEHHYATSLDEGSVQWAPVP